MDVFIFKKPLFGKEVEFNIFDADESVEGEVLQAYNEGLRLQKIFNFYDKGSELSRLNKRRKLRCSQELILVLSKALEISTFNPKYDVTHGRRFLARKENKDEIGLGCSYKDVTIDKNTVILENEEVMIDLGSIAKGYIVDKMYEILEKDGIDSGIVDGRGDLRIFGKPQIIDIQHPRKKEDIICSINLENRSVATSGDYLQYYGSYEKSHIVNSKDIISVTVVADDLMTADAIATAVFVSDVGSITSLLNRYAKKYSKHDDIRALVVDRNLKIYYYNDFEGLIIR